MAEIGLIASIFSVAAFGSSVATTLYQTADVMINADQQIYALAKHVSQSTAVLKHMGEVLETEKANCSKELLRDIRKIKHSCKRTFKEIKATTKPKRYRLLGSVRWLFKRTKAMELEARLDSQQSMLQCIIHTLSVSRLGRMDSRSKQDSEHIIGLKVEINLLKTFIMESYNNLGELKRAERLTEAEERYQSTSGGNTHPATRHLHDDHYPPSPDPVGGSNLHEPGIKRSPSPASRASDSEHEDSNLGSETDNSEDNNDDDDDDDADEDNNDGRANKDSHKSKNQNDQDRSNNTSKRFSEKGLVSNFSFQPQSSLSNGTTSTRRRESNFLLQMVPYRPRPLRQINSDRLILPYKQDLDNDNNDSSQGATNSVRLLLDKWTNSGSAPFAGILTEEATKEKMEFELAKERRTPNPQLDPYEDWSLPEAKPNENYNGPSRYSIYEDYPDFGGSHEPSRRPAENRYPQYGYPSYEGEIPPGQDFWRSPHNVWGWQNRPLGVEILHGLRSARGGIYYTKSNQFKQVHYVDHRIIYICQLAPLRLIPSGEFKCLNTELDKGVVRGEALDLLGYSYTVTDAGKLSISGDLELSEIEELVHLSYQALDRQLKTRSKSVVEERGWSAAVHDMNQMRYPNGPDVVPGYHSPMPPRFSDHNQPLYRQIPGRSSSFVETNPGRSASFEVRQSDLKPTIYQSVPIVKDVELEEKEARPRASRPEVRFTLPNANLTSGIPNAPKGTAAAQPSPAKPNNVSPSTKLDDEHLKLSQKRDHLQEKQEAARKAGDFGVVADITYYALPDLEKQIEKLREKQREEKEKKQLAAAKAAQIKKATRSRSFHTEVETESEHDEDKGDSKELVLYD